LVAHQKAQRQLTGYNNPKHSEHKAHLPYIGYV